MFDSETTRSASTVSNRSATLVKIQVAAFSTTYRAGQKVKLLADAAKLLLLASALTLAAAASPAWSQPVNPDDIAPFEVTYEVGNNLINAGTAKLSLTQSDGLWTYSLKTEPRGILKLAGKGHILETTTIRLEKIGETAVLQPQNYLYRQDDERRRAVDASFDWAEGTITHTYRGEEKTEAITKPIIDRLSATLLIMNILREDFDKTVLQVFDTGRIKDVAFVNDGRETLLTPLGEIETIRVLNKNARGGSRETSTWFAPSLDYVPVKIEHRKRNQLVARLTLKKLRNRVSDIDVASPGAENSAKQ
ncbi:MAG: DUF3108 domain-containing protein [Granulosicoccus sp.]|nr:DUF3108 domain-containing protein [Granulosicoccus sp.]